MSGLQYFYLFFVCIAIFVRSTVHIIQLMTFEKVFFFIYQCTTLFSISLKMQILFLYEIEFCEHIMLKKFKNQIVY
jgi:hypothetical protein